jgi:hypothetical protein|tara:strand:- start:108 stop:353 length:246 start_codon:yes stop_codon:yes gene_type:complete
MKKTNQYSIGLFTPEDVNKIAQRALNMKSFFTEEEQEKILRGAISRNLVHIRKYISDCIETEVHREFNKSLKEHQKQIENG